MPVDIPLILADGSGFGLQIEHPAHGRGIILGQGDALAGGGLVLETILADGQPVELINQSVGEGVGGDTHGSFKG